MNPRVHEGHEHPAQSLPWVLSATQLLAWQREPDQQTVGEMQPDSGPRAQELVPGTQMSSETQTLTRGEFGLQISCEGFSGAGVSQVSQGAHLAWKRVRCLFEFQS